MNWDTFFLMLDIVLYPALGLLFLFGVIRLFLGLGRARKESVSEQHIARYEYPATLLGVQAILLSLFLGCFLIAQHLSLFFLRMLLDIVSLVCGFFYVLSFTRVHVPVPSWRGRSRKKRAAQPKDILPPHENLQSRRE